MSSMMAPSGSARERSVPGSLPAGGEEDGLGLIDGQREQLLNRNLATRKAGGRRGDRGAFLRTVCGVVASAICYYLATRIAWVLCFPESKVSLFFPPHAVLVSILLLVPTRHWWA